MTRLLLNLKIILGCINDVANIKKFITSMYDFKEVIMHQIQRVGALVSY